MLVKSLQIHRSLSPEVSQRALPEYLRDFHFTTSQVEHNIPLIAHSNTQHRKWRTTSKDRSENEEGFKPRNKVVLQQEAQSRIPIYFPCLPETLLWKSDFLHIREQRISATKFQTRGVSSVLKGRVPILTPWYHTILLHHPIALTPGSNRRKKGDLQSALLKIIP